MTTVESTPVAEGAATYQIDPMHSRIHFSVRHLGISHVRGEFTGLSGTLVYDRANPEAAQLTVTVDPATFSSGQPQRDEHVKSADFLDVPQYPEITFKSTKVEVLGEEEGRVTGNLTLHGVTKEVVLEVEGPSPEVKDFYGNVKFGVTAKTRISRGDFGLTYNAPLETGGLLIGDKVDLTLDVQFAKQA
jgi:polyisoprenoid-binding protein YceI